MSRYRTLWLALAVVICARVAVAGTLASDTSAYSGEDPVTHIFYDWHGSTSYVGTVAPADLYGDIEWAVYAPGTFPAAFTGYTPDPTQFVYTYQLFETGPAPVSLFSLLVDYPAYNIGWFSGGGVSGMAPSSAVINPSEAAPEDANWAFAGIPGGGSSVGLAFTSPYVPKMGAGVTLDHGEVGPAIPLPTPSNVVPEPATWTLAAVGFLGLAVASRFGRTQARRFRRGM